MKCVFAAGGTGGHIQPAIALASELRRQSPDAEVLFVGGAREQEKQWIADAGFEFRAVQCAPLSGSLARKSMAPAKMVLGAVQCMGLMRRFRPDVVVGFGGYTSFPPLLAALPLGIPRVLLEQNVLPGRTNRLLARLVTEVHSQWEESRTHFTPRVRFRHSGNPVRRAILDSVSQRDAEARCLLVMGGSQGSEAINRLMLGAAEQLGREVPDLEIIHLAGPSYADELRAGYQGAGLRAEVHDYLDDMASAYRKAKLCVCRAGGTTIAELMALGIPAILIPYPYAAEDHQTLNARAVEDHGAGICLQERDMTPKALAEVLCRLFRDPAALSALCEKTHSLAVPDANEKILQALSALSESRKESKYAN